MRTCQNQKLSYGVARWDWSRREYKTESFVPCIPCRGVWWRFGRLRAFARWPWLWAFNQGKQVNCALVSRANSYLRIFYGAQYSLQWSRRALIFLIWISCGGLQTHKLRSRVSCSFPVPSWLFSRSWRRLWAIDKPLQFLYHQTSPNLRSVTLYG